MKKRFVMADTDTLYGPYLKDGKTGYYKEGFKSTNINQDIEFDDETLTSTAVISQKMVFTSKEDYDIYKETCGNNLETMGFYEEEA